MVQPQWHMPSNYFAASERACSTTVAASFAYWICVAPIVMPRGEHYHRAVSAQIQHGASQQFASCHVAYIESSRE